MPSSTAAASGAMPVASNEASRASARVRPKARATRSVGGPGFGARSVSASNTRAPRNGPRATAPIGSGRNSTGDRAARRTTIGVAASASASGAAPDPIEQRRQRGVRGFVAHHKAARGDADVVVEQRLGRGIRVAASVRRPGEPCADRLVLRLVWPFVRGTLDREHPERGISAKADAGETFQSERAQDFVGCFSISSGVRRSWSVRTSRPSSHNGRPRARGSRMCRLLPK